MEISSSVRYWFSHELGMEDPNNYTNESLMNSLDHHHEYFNSQHIAAALASGGHTYPFKRTFSHSSMEALHQASGGESHRPSKLIKTNSWNSSSSGHDISNTTSCASPNNNNILSFGSTTSDSLANSHHIKQQQLYESMVTEMKANYGNHQSYASKGRHGGGIANIRPPHASQDHIIAERKRREKLTQRFIALSAIVPNLKKMDKASVLGDAIKYMKQLQEKVKTLEEKLAKKSSTVESAIFVKKSLVMLDESNNSNDTYNNSNYKDDDENNVGHGQQPLPEIEARVCGKNVLVRIHCEKHKCVLVKILSLLEDNLKLTVTNSNLMPFGDSALHITIVAQMDEENCMTVKDLVENLRSAFLEFM